jgi:hypothetical protein
MILIYKNSQYVVDFYRKIQMSHIQSVNWLANK